MKLGCKNYWLLKIYSCLISEAIKRSAKISVPSIVKTVASISFTVIYVNRVFIIFWPVYSRVPNPNGSDRFWLFFFQIFFFYKSSFKSAVLVKHPEEKKRCENDARGRKVKRVHREGEDNVNTAMSSSSHSPQFFPVWPSPPPVLALVHKEKKQMIPLRSSSSDRSTVYIPGRTIVYAGVENPCRYTVHVKWMSEQSSLY